MATLNLYNKLAITILLSGFLHSCSVLVYTPVIATAALGFNKTDLSDQPGYKEYVGKFLYLKSLGNRLWKLKKFEGGRYYIERQSRQGAEQGICNLEANKLLITGIFSDSINGGRYFSATVYCQGQKFEAPLNHWFDGIKTDISFSVLEKLDSE